MLRHYLHETLARYGEIFCGESQVLAKIKEILAFVAEPEFAGHCKQLKKSQSLRTFAALLDALE